MPSEGSTTTSWFLSLIILVSCITMSDMFTTPLIGSRTPTTQQGRYLHALVPWWFLAMTLLYWPCALHLLRLGLHFPGTKASIAFCHGFTRHVFLFLVTWLLKKHPLAQVLACGIFLLCQSQKHQKIAEGPCGASFASVSWSAQNHPENKRKRKYCAD